MTMPNKSTDLCNVNPTGTGFKASRVGGRAVKLTSTCVLGDESNIVVLAGTVCEFFPHVGEFDTSGTLWDSDCFREELQRAITKSKGKSASKAFTASLRTGQIA